MPENCGLTCRIHRHSAMAPRRIGRVPPCPVAVRDGSPAGRLDVENHVIGGDQAPTLVAAGLVPRLGVGLGDREQNTFAGVVLRGGILSFVSV